MKKFAVRLTQIARTDLQDIYDYIAMHDSKDKAERVADRIHMAVAGLAHHPERGNYPEELTQLGIRDWREVFFKPYRIVYGIHGSTVFVYLIADGRRDMRTLLQRRLFGV